MLLMLAQVVILASGFGISIILGRGLGPVEFGVYGTALAVLTVFERILAAGIPIAAATLIARQHSRQAELEQAAFVLMCAWAMLLWAALEAGAPMISQLLHVDALLLRVLAFNIPAMGLYLAYDAIFSGRREFAVQSSLQTVQSLAKLAAQGEAGELDRGQRARAGVVMLASHAAGTVSGRLPGDRQALRGGHRHAALPAEVAMAAP